MRKLGVITSFIIATILLTGCQSEEIDNSQELTKTVVVSASIKNSKSNKILMYYPISFYTTEGKDSVVVKDSIDSEGNFSATFDLDEPIYGTFRNGRDFARVYISPGDSLVISFDADSMDQTINFTGKGADENNYLALYTLSSESTMEMIDKYYGFDCDTFIMEMERINSTQNKELSDSKLSASFSSIQEKNIEYELASNLVNYENYHSYAIRKQGKEQQEDDTLTTELINKIRSSAISDKELLTHAGYAYFINSYLDWESGQKFEEDEGYELANRLELINNLFTDNEVKNYAIASDMMMQISYFGLSKAIMDTFSIYKENLPNSVYTEDVQILINKWLPLMEGNPAPTFTYNNIKGEAVSLESFKGKYVYVDVWATWCGPCRGEAPFYTQLAKDFKGKDIVFLGVSVDSDKEAWEKHIKKEEPNSVQIISDKDWSSSIAADYNINGIPRFILIDKEGNIVSANAKRPSGAIREQLVELLGDPS